MATDVTFKCDGCGKVIAWDDQKGMVRIKIEEEQSGSKSSRALLHRDYCPECWEGRKSALVILA